VKKKCILGIDFDGVIVEDILLMMKVLKEKFPERYDSIDIQSLPSLLLHPEFLGHRQDFLRDSRYISDLSFCPGALAAVPLLRKFCHQMHMISGRWTYQEEPMEQFFKKWGISGHIDSKLLRDAKSKETALEAKLRNAQKAGVTHMIENDPLIAQAFEKAGMKVAFIVGLGKEKVSDTPNLRKYPQLWYFAMDVGLAGSVEKVFAQYVI